MELIQSYDLFRSVSLFRDIDTTQYNLSVYVQHSFYFVFVEPVFAEDPKLHRILAFVTDETDDIKNVMSVFEFANSKGAVSIEFL